MKYIFNLIFSETNTTIVAKRRGPNPLESYLKGDD